MGTGAKGFGAVKLLYSPAVRIDLERIRRFYAELDSDRGLRLGVHLRAELKLLKHHPRLGQPIDDPDLGEIEMRRLIIAGCEVRYAIVGDEIRILRIWHGREER